MSNRAVRNRRNLGFTLIELLVVISIISLLISILLPALSGARDSARSVLCLSNQRQLGILTHIYVHDYDGYMPFANAFASSSPVTATTFWYDLLAEYDDSWTVKRKPNLYKCPSTELQWGGNFNGNYAMSELLNFKTSGSNQGPVYRLSSVVEPTETLLYVDSFQRSSTVLTAWSYYGLQRFRTSNFSSLPPPYYHGGGVNAVMMGGNASTYTVEAAAENTIDNNAPWMFDPE